MKTQAEKGLLMVLVAMFVTALGCQSIGLAPAQNMEQRIAYAYAQNAGVRNAAASAAENGRLGKEEAKAVLEITNQARTILDTARIASGAGDIQTAEGRLSLAISLLSALQSRLNDSPRRPS